MGQVTYFGRIYVLDLKCVQTSLYDYSEHHIDSVLQVTTIIVGFQVHGILDEALIFTLAQGTLETENFHLHTSLNFGYMFCWVHCGERSLHIHPLHATFS